MVQNRKINKMIAQRMFVAKFISPTNNRPARVRLTDTWYNQSVILNFAYLTDRTIEQTTLRFLKEKNIPITATSVNQKTGEEIFLSDNMEAKIK